MEALTNLFFRLLANILKSLGIILGWLFYLGGGVLGLSGICVGSDDYLLGFVLCIGGVIAFFVGMFLIEIIEFEEKPKYKPIKVEERINKIKPSIKQQIVKTEETCKGCGAPLKTCTCDYCGRKIGNYRVIYTSLA